MISRRLGHTQLVNDLFQKRKVDTWSQGILDFFRVIEKKHPGQRTYIFLDEIDSTLGLNFTDDLFTTIRSIYNLRASSGEFENLVFCLSGVAAPSELIKSSRSTPYNVGHYIELADFGYEKDDLSDYRNVLGGVNSGHGEALLKRVLYWTDGHPYLTAKFCSDLSGGTAKTEADVDAYVDEQFTNLETLADSAHFRSVVLQFERDDPIGHAALKLYRAILKGRSVHDSSGPVPLRLKLTGLVKRDGSGLLIVRNRLYQRIFDVRWIDRNPFVVKTRRTRRWLFLVSGFAVLLPLTAIFLLFRVDISNIGTKNAAPVVAQFQCDKYELGVYESVRCVNLSDRYSNIFWSLGDGRTEAGAEEVRVAFSAPGLYAVKITAFPDERGGETKSFQKSITVRDYERLEKTFKLRIIHLAKSGGVLKTQEFMIDEVLEPSRKLLGTRKEKVAREFKVPNEFEILSTNFVATSVNNAGIERIVTKGNSVLVVMNLKSGSALDRWRGWVRGQLFVNMRSKEQAKQVELGTLEIKKFKEYRYSFGDKQVAGALRIQLDDDNGTEVGVREVGQDFPLPQAGARIVTSLEDNDQLVVIVERL